MYYYYMLCSQHFMLRSSFVQRLYSCPTLFCTGQVTALGKCPKTFTVHLFCANILFSYDENNKRYLFCFHLVI